MFKYYFLNLTDEGSIFLLNTSEHSETTSQRTDTLEEIDFSIVYRQHTQAMITQDVIQSPKMREKKTWEFFCGRIAELSSHIKVKNGVIKLYLFCMHFLCIL